jgi:hypothetical protein
MSFEIRTWAEVGIWNQGDPPALVVMSATFEDGQIFEGVDVLHEVDLEVPAGFNQDDHWDIADLPWREPLRALGYRRELGAENMGNYTPYGYAFMVERFEV